MILFTCLCSCKVSPYIYIYMYDIIYTYPIGSMYGMYIDVCIYMIFLHNVKNIHTYIYIYIYLFKYTHGFHLIPKSSSHSTFMPARAWGSDGKIWWPGPCRRFDRPEDRSQPFCCQPWLPEQSGPNPHMFDGVHHRTTVLPDSIW